VRPEYSDEWLDRISDFTQATRQELSRRSRNLAFSAH
jgi:hypothetical protein